MSDKKVEIKIDTVANTSGAEKTEQSLKKVNSSASQIYAESMARVNSQVEAEVAAMTRNTAAAQTNIQFKIGAAAAIAAAMRYATGELNAAVDAFDKLDKMNLKQLSGTLEESRGNVENWSKWILHPIKSVADWLRGGSVEAAVASANAALASVVKQREDQEKRFVESLAREEAAFLRLQKLQASQRKLSSALQGAEGAQELAKETTTPEAVNAKALRTDTQNSLAELTATVQTAQAALDELKGKAAMLTENAGKLKLNDPDRDKALEKAAAATEQAKKGELDLATLIQTTENDKAALLAKAQTGAEEFSREAEAALVAKGNALVESMKSSVERTGQQLTAQENAGMQELVGILADQKISPDEIGRVRVTMENLNRSRVESDAVVHDALRQLLVGYQASVKDTKQILEEIRAARDYQTTMQAQLRSLQSR